MEIMNPTICPSCGSGTVALRSIAGRKASALLGVSVELPASLELPTCDACLAYSVPASSDDAYEEAVNRALADWQVTHVTAMVDDLIQQHEVTRRRVAGALGITPSYLSNVTAGAKQAGLTVLRLLHAFVTNPVEFRHALDEEPLDDYAKWAWSAVIGNRGSRSVYESIDVTDDVMAALVQAAHMDAIPQVPAEHVRYSNDWMTTEPANDKAA